MTRQKEKFQNRQSTIRKYWFNIEDDKKAKISRVRAPGVAFKTIHRLSDEQLNL
jgi:hypothetical protein